MKKLIYLSLLCALAGTASANWSENFDSYATGSQMHGQGGWKGWDNFAGAGALTSPVQTISAPNSVAIGGASDLVHEYTGANSGTWTYTANIWMGTGHSGTTYFILMNKYVDGSHSTGDWSVELSMATSGLVLDDFRPELNTCNLHLGSWNEIKVVANLSTNAQNTFINGTLLSAGTWSTNASSQMNIAAVDLYADNTADVYYDNLSLVPEPGSLAVLALGALALVARRRKS